jgi:hypothetical protein
MLFIFVLLLLSLTTSLLGVGSDKDHSLELRHQEQVSLESSQRFHLTIKPRNNVNFNRNRAVVQQVSKHKGVPLRQHLATYKDAARQVSYDYKYYDLQKIRDEKLAELQQCRGVDATRLRQELRIIEAELRNPTGHFLADLAEKSPAEALQIWAKLQSLQSEGKLGSNTWERAQSAFKKRRSLQLLAQELETRTSAAKVEQEKSVSTKAAEQKTSDQGLVLEHVSLDDPSVEERPASSMPEGKLDGATDMTTDKPVLEVMKPDHPLRQRFFDIYQQVSGKVDVTQTTEQEVLFSVYQQMAKEGLISEKTVLERSPELIERYIRGVAHNLPPEQQMEKLRGLGELAVNTASTVYQGLTTPIESVKGRSELGGHPLVKVHEALSQIDLSELSAEQVVDLSAAITADVITGKGIAAASSYLGRIGALDKVQNAVSRVVEEVATASEAKEVATIEGVVFKVPQAVEETGILKNASQKIKSGGSTAKNMSSAEKLSKQLYTFTKSAGKHLDEVVQRGKYKGEFVRPYMRSPLTIQEIMATGKGVADATAQNALNFKVPGAFRGATGTWELVVDPEKKIVYHFLFKAESS